MAMKFRTVYYIVKLKTVQANNNNSGRNMNVYAGYDFNLNNAIATGSKGRDAKCIIS